MQQLDSIKLDDLKKEEYKSLRSSIDDATRMQIQIFTFSVITSTTLLGVILKFGNPIYTSRTVYVFLIPPLIIIPCSLLIKNLRSEIYRAGTYIQVFIENDSPFLYEGALSIIRDRFKSKESFDPIFSVYWILLLICAVLFVSSELDSKIPLDLPQSLPWLVASFFLAKANGQYREIPSTSRLLMLDQWRSIKSSSSLSNDPIGKHRNGQQSAQADRPPLRSGRRLS